VCGGCAAAANQTNPAEPIFIRVATELANDRERVEIGRFNGSISAFDLKQSADNFTEAQAIARIPR